MKYWTRKGSYRGSGEFAPFGSLGADGEHEGFDVDVAKLIAEDLGVELEIVL